MSKCELGRQLAHIIVERFEQHERDTREARQPSAASAASEVRVTADSSLAKPG